MLNSTKIYKLIASNGFLYVIDLNLKWNILLCKQENISQNYSFIARWILEMFRKKCKNEKRYANILSLRIVETWCHRSYALQSSLRMHISMFTRILWYILECTFFLSFCLTIQLSSCVLFFLHFITNVALLIIHKRIQCFVFVVEVG